MHVFGRKAAIGALISLGSIAVTWAVLLALICVIYSLFIPRAGEVAERAQALGVLPYCAAALLVGGVMTFIGVWLIPDDTPKLA
jgi:hypothetical protein